MKHKKSGFAIVLLSLLSLCFAYFLFVFYRYLHTRYVTESAYDYTITESYTIPALLVRDEHLITSSYNGVVQYQIEEAGKFISSTPLAIVYPSQKQAEDAGLRERLQQEIDLLKRVQKGAMTDAENDILNLGEISASALRELTSRSALGKGGETNQIRANFQQATAMRKFVTGEYQDFSSRIQMLENQMPTRPAGTTLKAKDSGYFSRYVDGNESVLSSKSLSSLTAAQVEQWLKKDITYQKDAFGKCVESFNWYLVTPMSEELLSNFQQGESIQVTFVGSEHPSVEAWVKEIRREETKTHQGLLILQSDCLTPDTVGLRTATVQLQTTTYRGVRYSKKAQRILSEEREVNGKKTVVGKKGVFVAGDNNTVRFKEVDVIYTGKDFCLSRLNTADNQYLSIFDSVIVEGRDLYDGKLLE